MINHLHLVAPATERPLPVPTVAEREAIKAMPRTREQHLALMRDLVCLRTGELLRARQSAAPLAFPFTVAAWNLERCYFPENAAELLLAQAPSVVLLSEVDAGMARTRQRHTAADIAEALGMDCAYGVEFLELGLGGPRELEHCRDGFNTCGFHGNALLGPALVEPVVIRLDDYGHWFRPESREHRVGGRCAIAGEIATEAGPMLFVSVHLESDGDGHFRADQMRILFNAVDALAPGQPVVIGGDLNTGLSDEGDFEQEPLFAEARSRGYLRHSGDLAQPTTRASMISPNPERRWKLDWFLTRGVAVEGSRIVAALSAADEPLSDHELIMISITGTA